MLEVLVESSGQRPLGAGPRLVALSVHGVAVLAAGLVTRAAPPDAPRPKPLPIEIFAPVPPALPARADAAGRTGQDGGIPGPPDVPATMPPAIPAVPVTSLPETDRPDARAVARRELWGPEASASAPGSVVKLAGEVDEQVEVLSARRPGYPPALAAAGISGQVRLAFVVDTLGRCEPGSVRVVSSTHPGFERAAMDAVLGSAFRPARVRGMPVRQLVQQSVGFRLE